MAVMKKVKKPSREKIVVLEEKQVKEAIGSSGYMVSWGLDGPGDGGTAPSRGENEGRRDTLQSPFLHLLNQNAQVPQLGGGP
jgi:hypothetical protein